MAVPAITLVQVQVVAAALVRALVQVQVVVAALVRKLAQALAVVQAQALAAVPMKELAIIVEAQAGIVAVQSVQAGTLAAEELGKRGKHGYPASGTHR